LGIFGGVAFSEKNVVNKLSPPPWPNHIMKIQCEIHFFTFFVNTDRNAPKKFRTEIWTFSFQICFRNQCSTSGSGQTEKTQIRVVAYLQFDHFPKSKIDSKTDLK
jgi:hypothetical protein